MTNQLSDATVYIVRQNADMTEGRGPMMPKYAFTSRSLADGYINSLDEYDRAFHDITELEVYSSIPNENDIRRTKALNKLTQEERVLLGLVPGKLK